MKWLRPNPVGVIIWVVAIALIALLGLTVEGTVEFDISDGRGRSVARPLNLETLMRLLHDEGPETPAPGFHVNVLLLELTLFGGYLVGNVLGAFLTHRARSPNPGLLYGALLGSTMIALFFASAAISKGYWGYWLARPALPDEARFDSVATITSVDHEDEISGEEKYPWSVNLGYSWAKASDWNAEGSYYWLERRILSDLRGRGVLPSTFTPLEDGRLKAIRGHVYATGLILKGRPSYEDAEALRGVIVTGEISGEPHVFAGLRSLEISNDHYAYYELLFNMADPANPRLVAHQHFFYDLAGLEGGEWWAVFLVLFIPFAPASLLLTAIVQDRVWRRFSTAAPNSQGAVGETGSS